MDERDDICKKMNAIMLNARVLTIRDMQIDENKKLEQEYVDA
jgi:hypothetical protein